MLAITLQSISVKSLNEETNTQATKFPSFQFVARAENNWRKSWAEDILYDLQVEESGSD